MTKTLRYTHFVPHIWSALEHEIRKGWVHAGVTNPETVAEHTLELLRLGDEVAREALLSDSDRADLLSMLEVHDWPEAIDGDEITLHGVDHAEEADRGRQKQLREEAVMTSICEHIGEEGQYILAFWRRFEMSDDPIATLAREIDKYQAIEKAFFYEHVGEGPVGLGEEFVRFSPPMTHPELVKRVTTLRHKQ
jgi:5'-deoxynucleotidase YfbR-like HD superfamily hydrolase